MTTKILEVRDRATFIPVLATRMSSDDETESYYLRRFGFVGPGRPLVIVSRLADGRGNVYPLKWEGRTMPVAHEHIAAHFDKLRSGDVVDVEYILGETKMPKFSERATSPLEENW